MIKETRNFSVEETAALLDAYNEAPTYEEQQEIIKEFAAKFHKPESSIRSKLVKLKVYKSAPKISGVLGRKPETKIELVKKMEKITKLNLEGLDKAPKLTLDRLLKFMEEECIKN